MRLSDSKRALLDQYVARRDEINQLPLTTLPTEFLERFPGGAIWRIFLLHCWQPSRYPIYDQHVHRAMNFIRNQEQEEISAWNNKDKIQAYVQRYVPFFNLFDSHDSTVDRALWIFGRFIKMFPNFYGHFE